MADRTTPLQVKRRVRFDVLERASRSPLGVRILYRGVGYACVRCPGCRQRYWRIYYSPNILTIRMSPRAYCSDSCSLRRQAALKKARMDRYLERIGRKKPLRKTRR
jgi:hypothetical protein